MAASLKEKISILKSLIKKLDNKFNLATAEMEDNDLWKSSVLGVVSISKSKVQLEKIINRVISFVEEFPGLQLVKHSLEYY